MAKKILLIILTIFINVSFCAAYTPCLQKGSLIKVYTKTPLSTKNLEEGSIVYFAAPLDVWILEKKAVSKGDIFRGYVSMLKIPVQGVNAAMSISITDKINPQTGEKKAFYGKILFFGNEILGGNLTNPASYNRTIHPRKVYGNHWGGSLQYVPSGEYEFGRHVGITSRDDVFIRLDEDYYI